MKPVNLLKGRLLSNILIALVLDSPAAPYVPELMPLNVTLASLNNSHAHTQTHCLYQPLCR